MLIDNPLILIGSRKPKKLPITASEYDQLNLTDDVYWSYQMTAKQYDTEAKTILTGVTG